MVPGVRQYAHPRKGPQGPAIPARRDRPVGAERGHVARAANAGLRDPAPLGVVAPALDTTAGTAGST